MSDLGDRMKEYEGTEAQRRFMPLLPVLARLDGRGFSRFTKGLERPYDPRMTRIMQEVTQKLVFETGALTGYTQSDEITLLFYSDSRDSQIFFDGRIGKMHSILASMATLYFYQKVCNVLGETYSDKLPMFDCRVWQVPTKEEAANVFLWRELDATKNSISMAAQHYFSHSELQGKNGSEMQEMLWSVHGVNWNDYEPEFKRGTYVQRKESRSKFTAEEIAKLPEKHAARTNPDLEIVRSVCSFLYLQPLSTVANRVGLLFDGEQPVYKTV